MKQGQFLSEDLFIKNLFFAKICLKLEQNDQFLSKYFHYQGLQNMGGCSQIIGAIPGS